MGGGAYRLDLVRPFGLDAIRIESGAGVENRPGGFVGAGVRRSLRARRRARRTARPHPAIGDARRRRALRRGDRDRRASARRLASRFAARASRRAALDGSDDRRFSLGDRRHRARDQRGERRRRDWRTGDDRRSDRGDLSVLRQYRVSRSRRRAESAAPRERKTCATPISRALPRIAKRSGGSAPARAGA